MQRLFDIDQEGDVKLQDDTFLLIPELRDIYKDKKLGSKAIRYIVLFADYNSPYRQLLPDKRKEEVALDIYGNKGPKALSSSLVQEAIKAYRRLQYDPIIEQYLIYTEKIAEYNNYIKEMPIEKDTAQDLQKVMLGLEQIIESREKIKELILKKQEEEKVMGGGGIAFIEEFIGAN